MLETIKQCFDDLHDYNLPRDLDAAFDKLKADMKYGQQIGWWYKDDEKYAKEYFDDDESWQNNPPFRGMIIIPPDREVRYGIGSDLELDECVVIVHEYPVEKCYCESDWMALSRLLDDDDLVSVVNI